MIVYLQENQDDTGKEQSPTKSFQSIGFQVNKLKS